MIALSFSAWKDADCPYRFNALRIARTYKEPESDAMIIGVVVADVLARYRRHCYRAGLQSDIQWFDALDLKKIINRRISAEVEEQALALVAGFKQSDMVTVPLTAQWVGIEKRLTFGPDLAFLGDDDDAWFGRLPEPVHFRAVSDFAYLLGDTFYVIDDKTGFGTRDPLQMEIYAYLVPRALPPEKFEQVERIVCVWNEVTRGRKETVLDVPRDDASSIREKILARIKEVNSWTEYPAKACDSCKWCTVPGCPVRAGAEKALMLSDGSPLESLPTEITNRDQAERAVLFLQFADDVIRRVKTLLRPFVEENGPVQAGGKVAELRPNERWAPKSVKDICNALLGYGCDPDIIWSNLSLSERDLKKICRRAGLSDRLQMLMLLGERKTYEPRFGLYNPKADF